MKVHPWHGAKVSLQFLLQCCVTQFSILKTRMCFQGKGGGTGRGAGICKALEYAAAREWHILAPLYAVPLPAAA